MYDVKLSFPKVNSQVVQIPVIPAVWNGVFFHNDLHESLKKLTKYIAGSRCCAEQNFDRLDDVLRSSGLLNTVLDNGPFIDDS